jgi:DNA uptake protein ComE-like DNA-binding protein
MYAKLLPYIDIQRRDAHADFPPRRKETEVSLAEKSAEKPDSLFAFDPNTVDSISLTRLGFSSKQARTILNYRRKGGNFKTKEDFGKSFAVSEQMYAKLLPYIEIQRRDAHADFPPRKKETEVSLAEKSAEKPDSLFAFDPNTVDSVSLTRLGFSPKQARSILNYRRKGGNFKTKEDFGKLFVVSKQMYDKLLPYIEIRR